MKKLILSVLIAAFAVTPALAADVVAKQPTLMAPVVAVVDIEKIIRECTASKGIRDQLSTKRDSYQKEITAGEKGLRDEWKKIVDQKGKLPEAQLAEKQKAFEAKAKDFQKNVQAHAKTLDQALNGAVNEVKKAAGQIVAEAAAAKGANVVLDKSQVVVVEAKLDLTNEVMETLNKKLPSVQVKFTETKAK